jgi:hypothetical protein
MRHLYVLTRCVLPGDIFFFSCSHKLILKHIFLKQIKKSIEATLIMSHNNILKFDGDPALGYCHSVEVGYGVRVVDEHTVSIFRVRVSYMIVPKCMYMCNNHKNLKVYKKQFCIPHSLYTVHNSSAPAPK